MQKRVLSAAVFAGLVGLLSTAAEAADGTITINGSVSDTTCSINGAASGSPADVAVTLPNVPASSLTSVGATAGTSNLGDIRLSLSGCSGTATKAIAHFENGPTVDQASGNLVNQASASPAQNVQVRLLNAKTEPISILTQDNNDISTDGATITGGAATLNYFAQYYATGEAQPGNVSTSVQYTMQYQ
ncbi:type 1 fimbrial protein [Paraburkholderia sp. LEh10]|uniref:fimbrial protein n=1 Tax=Paraburkholderia sp. LEh10 TaxID=2821353 RepID=UPI001AE7AD37|nr:fimbrial protein [Paraburkholderia sp. LEh10]MBP0592718.1 type 1 fimbrial protein [Paraburkholderia sp. LEh10]